MDARDGAFEAAYLDLFPRAATLAYRLLGDRAAAEDTAAEALARAFARWPEVGALPYRDGWVLRVATNVAIDALRKRRVVLPLDAATDHSETAALRMALVAALRALPRRQREAVALRYLSGLSDAEVAQTLGVSPSAANTHVHRGLAALRRQLGPGFDQEAFVDG
jgi:RNA polymerase sigma-70 factor (ECF subfamily)